MRMLRRFALRLTGLFRKEPSERDFDAELESHLTMHADDNMRTGMDAVEARRQAVLKLGGIEKTRQEQREGRTMAMLENLLQDLRFTARQLRHNKGFAVTAILILSLGICANVAIFSFIDSTLIKPLPYRDAPRLMNLYESNGFGAQYHLSYPDYLDWKAMSKTFSAMAGYQDAGYLLKTSQGIDVTYGVRVTDGFFRLLDVHPVLGRDFHDGEDQPSAERTVLLSYGAWQKRYGGRNDILGTAVTLNDEPYVVVGVLPREFSFPSANPGEFWTAMHAAGSELTCRACHGMYGIARLKDGATLEQASAEIAAIAQQLERQYPDSNRRRGGVVVSLVKVIVGDIKPILLVLLGGAALLLAIVCVNVSSLLLVRSENRRRETAIRNALGASRGRLVRQFITEGVVLVGVSAVLGVGAAYEVIQLMQRLIPETMLHRMPYLQQSGLTSHVFLFALAISLLAGGLFASIPLLRLPTRDLRSSLTEGSRGAAGTIWRRLGPNLVVVELAIAMVLLAGAGLLSKSLYRLLHVETGIQTDHQATIRLGANGELYKKSEARVALDRQVLAEIRTLPGVESAGIVDRLPLGDGDGIRVFTVTGRPDDGARHEANSRAVSPTYFPTVKATLLRGRYFTDSEDASKPPVVIINQALARQYFPGEDPIGKHLNVDSAAEIVGVVDDIREGQLDMAIRPAIYASYYQQPGSDFALVVRTAIDEDAALKDVTDTLHRMHPDLVLYAGTSMTDILHDSSTAYLHRSSAWLVSGFAGLALLLGAIGLYGVISYAVSQRTREIGVRMALGARKEAVQWMIFREAGRLAIFGMVIGVVCSVLLARLAGKLLFGVSAWDVSTLLVVAAMLGSATLLASYLPARRAAMVNPTEALRME